MDIKTRGIVLQTVKYSESSVIVRIFTERLGLVSYIVKGVRSNRSSAKAAMLRPLTLLEMDVTHRENKGLQNIKEYKRAYNYSSLPFDTVKASIALFMLEVISKSLKEHDPHEETFEFVYDCFCHMDEMTVINNDLHLQFLVHYAGYLGFAPHGESSDETPYFDMQEGSFTRDYLGSSMILDRSTSELISLLSATAILQPLPIRLNRQIRKDLLHHLLKYYSLHLEGFTGLRSPEVLEMIFD
jgi:DNA repair protein RecO (recombination protein O)